MNHVPFALLIGLACTLILGCGKERANFTDGQNQTKPKILVGHTDDESKLPEGMVLYKDRDPNAPARVNRMPVVIDDPAEIRRTQEVFEKAIAELYDDAIGQVAKGKWLFQEHTLALKIRREKALADLHQMVSDERLDPRGRTKAAEVLIIFAEPAGEKLLRDMLQSPRVELRLAALQSLGEWELKLDLSKSDWATRVHSLLDDSDQRVVEEAAKVCRYRKIPGSEDKLIAVLEKNNLKNPATIANQLAEIATTKRAVGALLPHVLKDNSDKDYHWTGFSFRNLIENPDPEVSGPVRKAVYEYLLQFRAQRYDQTLVRDLVDVVGADAISVLEDIKRNARDPVSRSYALDALARLQPEKAIDLITQHIDAEGYRSDISKLRDYVAENDFDRIAPIVLNVCQRSNRPMDRGIVELFWTKFGIRGRQFVKEHMDNLDEHARMWATWKLENRDLVAALTEMQSAGIIQMAPHEVLQKMQEEHKEYDDLTPLDTSDPYSLTGALVTAGIVVKFDTESDMLPSYHDRLILEFADASNGRFAPQWPIQTWHQANEEDYDAPYTVQFVLKNRLFQTGAENYGDWYDVEAVVRLINFALEIAGDRRCYIALATGDQTASFVFADPVAFLPIAKKYGLPISRDPTEAIRQGIEFEKRVIDRIK